MIFDGYFLWSFALKICRSIYRPIYPLVITVTFYVLLILFGLLGNILILAVVKGKKLSKDNTQVSLTSAFPSINKYSRTSIRFYVVNKIIHYQLGTPFFSALHDEHGGSVSDPVGICSPFFSLCHCRHQLATRLLHVLRSANGSGKTQLSLNRCRNNGIKFQLRISIKTYF